MSISSSIPLAKRTLAEHDPIDHIFQLVSSINQKRKANGFHPIINLCVGEPHLAVNVAPLNTLRQFLQDPQTKWNFKYSQLQGRDETLLAICQLYQKYYPKVHYHSNEVMISNGATQALWNAFGILINENDKVLAFEPTYSSYKTHTEFFGGRLQVIPTRDQQFRPSAKVLETYLIAHPETKALVLNYPNNPSGIDLNRGEIEAITLLLKHYPNVAVIVDDVYRELSNQEHLTLLDIDSNLKDRCIMINSASKGLMGAPDMRIGMAGANSHWIEKMTALQSKVVCSISLFTQQALIAGIDDELNPSSEYKQWLENNKRAYNQNVAYVREKLNKLNIKVIYGGSGFFLLADFSRLIGMISPDGDTNKNEVSILKTDHDIVAYLLYTAGVATIPASAFGIPKEQGYLRISCAKEIEDLTQAMLNIENALKKIAS